MSTSRRRIRDGLLAVGASLALLGLTTPAQAEQLPEGDLPQAVANFVASPDKVPGANDWSCEPSQEHPNPVILLPGTSANIGANFVKAAPRLKNNGYCVFGMNYGFTINSLGRFSGLGHITDSAKQLDTFVDKVRAATGARKVDLIGHSQGGNVPLWWIKKMGGAAQTAHYVGWAPSSHGSDLNGLENLAKELKLLGFINGFANLAQFPGVLEQASTSEYTKRLWSDGDTVPKGPDYTVISTKNDHVVTPYQSQRLNGPDVHNIVLQDKCAADPAGHVGLFNDDPTLQLTMNALADGSKNFQPRCEKFGVPGV